jgi:hypothetical protein
MEAKSKLHMLFIIVDRNKGSKITDLLDDRGMNFHVIFLGRGTANSEILEYLGFGETEKDVVCSIIKEELIDDVFTILKDDFKIENPTNGVAFTVPINSIGGLDTFKQFIKNSQKGY